MMMMHRRFVWISVLIPILAAGWGGAVRAQDSETGREPLAVTLAYGLADRILDSMTALDRPNDAGEAIVIRWPALTKEELLQFTRFTIYRAPAPEGPFAVIGLANMESTEFVDTGNAMPVPGAVTDESGEPTDPEENPIDSEEAPGLQSGMPYYYKLGISTVDAGERLSPVTGPITARPQWFHTGKTPIMVGTVLFFVLVALFIELARRGWVTYVRPIAGMNEIVNAIGRATEMGRPILYVLGLGAPDEIATIASYTILARVARRTAEYRTTLIVPCNEPIVMTIAQETVKNAYIEAGHPDAYNEDMVYFVTSMQFAYVAAVNGIMLRERTATNCYFGKFYAESLLLSETGNIAGSIQVAGTDEVAQLPFFVTTCDYTLIGEELYAASAYLGRDPLLLGALKAQDLAKAIIMLLIIIGTILISFDISWLQEIVSVNV